MVLDLVETLNTRRKRSALIGGGFKWSEDWTPMMFTFYLVKHKQHQDVGCINTTNIWVNFSEVKFHACTNINANKVSMLQIWAPTLKFVPAQEHRFQMVLDGF